MQEENEVLTKAIEDETKRMKAEADQEKANLRAEKIDSLISKLGSVRLSEIKRKIREGDYKTHCVSTGFDNLDNALDGGLYPGLYVLGAISSLGKTSLMLQIADQIAAAGHDVAYISMEMAAEELISKSISRLTYKNCNGNTGNAKTTRAILNANKLNFNQEEVKLIETAEAEYDLIGNHIYIYEGVGNIGAEEIRSIIKNQIDLTSSKPVLMIDYLQILAPYDPRFSDKQNTDKSVLELKRISRDFEIPVFAISSFNRDSYSNEVEMTAFKESGAIEYGSDVLLALQPKGIIRGYTKKDIQSNIDLVKKCKRSLIRNIELVILKNRNGKTGIKVGFTYKALFNQFIEAEYLPDQESFQEDDEDDDIPFEDSPSQMNITE